MTSDTDTMEKEPNENDSCLEDDKHKPRVRPKSSKLDSLESRGFSRRSVLVLGALLILILILLIIVIVLAVLRCRQPPPSRPLCDSPDCYHVSGQVLGQLNTSLDPCSDFYDFACGGWIRDHPIPPQYGEVGVPSNAWRDFLRQSRVIVETLPHAINPRTVPWKLKAFYHSCMDLDSIDSAMDVQLKQHIQQLQGWKPIQTWATASWDWEKVMRDLNNAFEVFPFFKISVKPDDVNPIKNVILITPSGLGLPHPSYYFRPEKDKVIVAYIQLMTDLAQHLGAVSQDSRSFARDIFHFEKRIAEAFLYRNLTHIKESKKFTVKELHNIAPRIHWINHLKAFFQKVRTISDSTEVYVTSADYLQDVSAILSTTDMGSLNEYLIWTFVLQYSQYLSEPYRDAYDSYLRTLTGAVERKPRWEYCIETTNGIFNLALVTLYVRKNIPMATFNATDDVFRSVQDSFLAKVRGLPQMESGGHPADKLKTIGSRMLYENFALSDDDLNTYYKELSILKTHLMQNIQNGAAFRRFQYGDAIQTADRNYSIHNLVMDRNSYNADLNEIVLNPFLLQEPFYEQGHPKYLTFGGLGSYIGHGFTKGFEELGRVAGHSEQRSVFWDSNMDQKFTQYYQCLESHSRKYGLDAMENFKQESVLNSAADITGVQLAYEAFEKWESAQGDEPTLPGVSYSPQQLFFIAYAQSLCSTSRQQSSEDFLRISQYLPSKERVSSTLSQVPQFADAYGCRSDAALNPSGRCHVW